jgi:sec-independent protein translocase protein TatC
MADVDQNPAETPAGHMTLFEHLAELRTRVMRMLIAIALGAVIGFVVYPYITEFLLKPYADLRGEPVNFLTLDPLEPFAVRLKIAGYLGIALAMPVILWQIWRFVAPGLYKKEKRYAIPFVVSSLLLFVLGATIAYLTLGPALQFLTTIGGSNVVLEPSPDKYTMLCCSSRCNSWGSSLLAPCCARGGWPRWRSRSRPR